MKNWIIGKNQTDISKSYISAIVICLPFIGALYPTWSDAAPPPPTEHRDQPAPPTSVSGLADLYVSKFTLEPAVPVKGVPVKVNVQIYNQGTKDVGSFRVEWWAGENFPGPAKVWSISGVKARGGRVLTYTYPGYSSWYGQLRTKVVIDPDNSLVNENKTNNIYTTTISVRR